MKKEYIKPIVGDAQLLLQCQILAGSRKAKNLSDTSEGVNWDDDGLDDDDLLR